MASGGSSGRAGSGSRSFDFGSDDVLCSYDDYAAQEAANGKRSDSSVKDFHESRVGRPFVNVYSQQEDHSKEDMISAVEKCMKKYADNLLRFLEGISGRLSQLEVYCYKLERSIGELRSDISQEQSEADGKFKSLEKHLQEVHRSVQILRDKQELAEAQKELAKLQLVQKVSSGSSNSKINEDSTDTSVSESQKEDNIQDTPNQHLALALPRQIPAPTSVPARASEQQMAPASINTQQDHYAIHQAGTYYPQQPDIQYVQRSQVQNLSLQAPPQQPHIANQTQPQPVPQYQQQWSQQSSQQFPQQVVQPSQPTPQAQMRAQAPPSYPVYPSYQPPNPVPKTFPGSGTMQASYSAIPPPGGARPEAVPFSYGGGSGGSVSQPLSQHQNVVPQPPPQPSQSSFGSNLNKSSYVDTAAYSPVMPQTNVQGYSAMYSIDGARGAHPQNFPGNYPPSNISGLQSQQLPPGSSVSPSHPGLQLMHNHPYGPMIEKAIGMGYPRDLVLSVIHRMGESGQPIDFNALLDGLNSRASSASPRTWSA